MKTEIRFSTARENRSITLPTAYLEALKAAPKAVKEFIDSILERFKKQEKSILYEPIPAPKTQSREREKRSKNKDFER